MDKEPVINSLKENTIKMYDNTIEEMIKRGAPQSDIEVVERAKAESIAAYDYKVCDKKSGTIVLNNGAQQYQNESFLPLMTNSFLVWMGDVPVYYFRSVFFDLGKKNITFSLYETPTFSPIKYFSEHRKFDKVKIEFINNIGETQRTDCFMGLKLKSCHIDGLCYESERPLTSEISFSYRKYVPTAN